MAAPFIVFESAAAHSGTGAISVTRPAAGIGKAGDLELLFVESANQDVATPSGFTIHPQSPVGVGTAAATTATRLSIFYRWSLGETTAISVADAGDHTLATLVTLRGVDRVAPFEAITTFSSTSAGTSFSQTGLNVTTDFASILFAVVADEVDSTATQNIVPNCTFSKNTEPTWLAKSYRSTAGNGGGLTYRTATISLPWETAVSGLSITSTGSIIPCAVYFYVRGTRYGEVSETFRSHCVSDVSTSGSTQAPSQMTAIANTGVTASTTTANIPRVVGTISGCLELLFLESAGGPIPVPPGWQHVPGSPLTSPDKSALQAITSAVLWRISDGDMTAISVKASLDHIIGIHAAVFNCDELNPFLHGAGGDQSETQQLSGYSYVNYDNHAQAVFSSPFITPPLFSEFLGITALFNPLDASTTQFNANSYRAQNSALAEFPTTSVLNRSINNTTGNGGGISFGITRLTTNDTVPENDTVRFLGQAFYLNTNSSFTVCKISFVLKSRTLRNYSAIRAEINSVANVSSVVISTGIKDDTPRVLCVGDNIISNSGANTTYSVPLVDVNGNTLPAEALYGKLELLVMVEGVGVSSPFVTTGWAEAPYGDFTTAYTTFNNLQYHFRFFYRKHPYESPGDTIIGFSGTNQFRARIFVFDNVYTADPIITAANTIGYDGWAGGAGTPQRIAIADTGGNGYDPDLWPQHGYVITPSDMALVFGYMSRGNWEALSYLPTLGPETSLDTWERLNVGTSYETGVYSVGKRFSASEGALPAVHGRLRFPDQGKLTSPSSRNGLASYWICIASRFSAPNKKVSISISLKESIRTVIQGDNQCANIVAYGVKAEGTGAISVPPATIRPNGQTISASDRNGLFEVLIAETADQEIVITPGDGWSWLLPWFMNVSGVVTFRVFWRVHPDDDNSNVEIADPGDHVVAMRLVMAGVDLSSPMSMFARTSGSSLEADGRIYNAPDSSSVLGICCSGRDMAALPFNFDGNGVPIVNSRGQLDSWQLAPHINDTVLNLVNTGTTQGSGGTISVYFGKQQHAKTNYYPPTFGPHNLNEYDGNGQYVGAWIYLNSAFRETVVEQSASITHSSTFFVTTERSPIGQPFSALLGSSVASLGLKNPKLEPPLFLLGSQAVSTGAKGAIAGLFIETGHDWIVYVEKREGAGAGEERFVSASILFSEDVSVVVSKGSASLATLLLNEDVAALFLKGRAGVAFIELEELLSFSSKKGSAFFCNFTATSLLSSAVRKNSRTDVMINSPLLLFAGKKKGGFGATSIGLLSFLNSLGLLMTTFAYGDLVVVDLRATPLGLEQSCLRLSPVIEVRRGEDLEFSATREGLEAPGRRRYEDIVGGQVRLLGREIVCVREVFDESK